MRPVSSRFLAALRGSHTSRYRVRVLTTFQTGTDPSGTEVGLVTGSVTLDGTANERASLDLTLDSQAGQRWPANQFGVLAPFGHELYVERGIAGLVTSPPPVEGGTVTDLDGYRYHTFTGDDSLTVNREVPVEYLIVAGGGGGGGGQVSGYGGSGGGAGGVVTGSTVLSPGSYSVTVGDGGSPLTNGDNSEIDGVGTAIGGGAGGGGAGDPAPGSGGSGGGAIPVGAENPGSGTVGQGNDGGSIGVGGTEAGAGGGGAGAPGGDTGPGARDAGDGGDGIEWPAGSGTFYGGGGGGSNGSGGGGGVVSSGGLGGGGFGHSGSGDGGDGVPNTGGGGGATRTGTPGSGGSGVVVVRYPVAALQVDVDDTTEYVPLGYFRIQTIEQDDAPRSPIRITARDRMAAIIEARMLEPRTFPAGTTFAEVFENLVLEVYPNAVLDIDDAVASSTLREPATVEEDRYGFLRDMATSRGRVMFFDHRGVLVVAPEPDSTAPVFTVNEGDDGVLINLRRQLSRAGVYNAVVAEGTESDYDNDEPPARAVVFDDNPDSATYFFGPFGQVPRFYTSPFIFTDAQAQSAAASILYRTTGIPYTLRISSIPNPALEPLDPITVIFEAGRQEIHVIDVITIPLTSDQAMTINTRSLVQFIAGQERS